MIFRGVFMNSAQKYKYSEARIKANNKYANKMYRPNIFINAEYKDMINAWLNDHGFKSVNEYLIACMIKDGIIPDCKE